LTLIKAAFSVIMTLKVRNEIKHEVESLQNIVVETQTALGIQNPAKPSWKNSYEY
jgi:hypothetical protein